MSTGQSASPSPDVPDSPPAGRLTWNSWTAFQWLAAAIATCLLVLAIMQRLGGVRTVDLRWVEIADSDAGQAGDAGDQPSATERAFRASPILLGTPTDLDDVGALLDDPNLGLDKNNDQPVAANDEIPLKQRWHVELAAGLTEGQYARQLAALGIELGVLGKDGNIEYLAHVG